MAPTWPISCHVGAPHPVPSLDRMEQEELAIVRRAYAKQIKVPFKTVHLRVEAAFATVRREALPGPWPILYRRGCDDAGRQLGLPLPGPTGRHRTGAQAEQRPAIGPRNAHLAELMVEASERLRVVVEATFDRSIN
jgi:hypothetical protein